MTNGEAPAITVAAAAALRGERCRNARSGITGTIFFVQTQVPGFAFACSSFRQFVYPATYKADARVQLLPLVTAGHPDTNAVAEAGKRRWAQQSKNAKPQASEKHAVPKPVSAKRAKGGLTAAGRKRLSENMKKRWAEREKSATKA